MYQAETHNRQLTDFFIDRLLLNNICQYLSIPQRLRLSICNKKLRFIMQEFCKIVLQDNKLPIIQGKQPIHQMRFYFDRCLRIFKEENIKEEKGYKEEREYKENKGKRQKEGNRHDDLDKKQSNYQLMLKRTIENPFKFEVITFFEVGHIFSCCLNIKQKACIFKTKSLIETFEEDHKKLIFEERSDIMDIKCKGEKLLYVKNNGEVYLCESDKKSQDIVQKERLIEWTLHIPIAKIFASFNYAILVPQNANTPKNSFLKYIFNYETEHLNKDEDSRVLVVLNLINLNTFILKLNFKMINSIAVGHKEAYIVNDKHESFIVEFDHFNQGGKELQLKTYLPFEGKSIVKIASGYSFYYALERNLQNIEDWTTERTLQWLKEIGFADYIQIAKAQKLDGKKLVNIQKKYLENVLGITKLNMRQKILMCISEVKEGKTESDQLYVWGKNQYGQLAFSHANYITHPLKIKMNFLGQREQVDSIFCGWYETFIRTRRGRVYRTIATVEKKKKKANEEKIMIQLEHSDEEELKKDLEEYQKMKPLKKRKKTEDFREKEEKKIKTHHKKYEEEERWIECNVGKAFFVDGYKEFSFYVQCPEQTTFQPEKRKKLRTAKAVLDRILWGNSQIIEEFKVGYIDKDMGLIETSAGEIHKFEFKEARIKYIKKNNIVVWDRDNKFDHLL